MTLRLTSLVLFFALACTPDRQTGQTHSGIQRIPCSATPDCSARGGACAGGQCVADNECATDGDCARGEVCTTDVNFGGLCGVSGSTPLPGPAWTCAIDADCPTGQSCNSGTCGLPPTTTVEDCTNGSDDDGDGDVDCSDSDCSGNPACNAQVEDCANGVDDDGDGDVDCNDRDCGGNPACGSSAEICSNGIDDDGDADVDCADVDCGLDFACTGATEDCSNGVDDNADGAVDCADTFCIREPICQTGCTGTQCPCDVLLQDCASPTDRCYPGGALASEGQCYASGSKTNGDACVEPPVNTPDACQGGLLCLFEAETDPTGICRVICASTADCAAGESCYAIFPQPTDFGICHPATENCSNTTDDDNDGDIDCGDSDCANDPSCLPTPTPEDCTNMIDDDGDGDVDCSDVDCTRVPPC